jgi:hypothetical protein
MYSVAMPDDKMTPSGMATVSPVDNTNPTGELFELDQKPPRPTEQFPQKEDVPNP